MTILTSPNLDLRIEDAFNDLEFALHDSQKALSELRHQITLAKKYLVTQKLTASMRFTSDAEVHDAFVENLSNTMRHLASYLLAYGELNGTPIMPLTAHNLRNCVRTAVQETEESTYSKGIPKLISLSMFKDFEPAEVRQVDRDYHGRNRKN